MLIYGLDWTVSIRGPSYLAYIYTSIAMVLLVIFVAFIAAAGFMFLR